MLALVQAITEQSAGDVATLTATLPDAPREGNLLLCLANTESWFDVDAMTFAGWTLDRDARNITGLVIWRKIASATEPQAVTLTLTVPTSCAIKLWEFSSVNPDPLGASASDTLAESTATAVSTGSTAPEWADTGQADSLAIAVFARIGTTLDVTALSNDFAEQETLVGLSSSEFGGSAMVIATRTLSTVLASLETTAQITGGTLAPAGLLVIYKAAPSGPVARSLRQRYEEAPNAQTVEITAEDPLNWTASADVDWVQLTPASGTAPSTLTVKLDPAGLTPGSYEGTLTIEAVGDTHAPRAIALTLNVTPEMRAVGATLPQAFQVGANRGWHPGSIPWGAA